MGASETQAYRRHVGFVFQDFKLIQRMTVIEYTTFVPRVMGMAPTVQQRRAEQVLKWVGLEHRLDAYPSELSGGEQQRVAIARALINDPAMVLADEPTGNLDPDLALEIMNLFREINARGTAVVVATHDRELIRRVGRRMIMLEAGVITEESPAVGDVSYFRAEDRYGAQTAVDTEPEVTSVSGVVPRGWDDPTPPPQPTSTVPATVELDAVVGAAESGAVTDEGVASVDDAATRAEDETHHDELVAPGEQGPGDEMG
jgi:ABC-type methionine transport system ATPase subunit